MTVCASLGCDRQVADARICSGCTRTLETRLREIPGLADELTLVLVRATRYDERSERPGNGDALPYDAMAASLGWDLRNTLAAWTRALAQPAERLPAPTVGALAGWLVVRVSRARQHADAGLLVDEIASVYGRLTRAIDRDDVRLVGRCCQTPLYAPARAAKVRCTVCSTQHDVAERTAALGAEVRDVLATAAEIERAVAWLGQSVRDDQISRWVGVGMLAVKARTQSSSALYRVGDVLDLLARRDSAQVSKN